MYNNKLCLKHAKHKINTYDTPQPTGSIGGSKWRRQLYPTKINSDSFQSDITLINLLVHPQNLRHPARKDIDYFE